MVFGEIDKKDLIVKVVETMCKCVNKWKMGVGIRGKMIWLGLNNEKNGYFSFYEPEGNFVIL